MHARAKLGVKFSGIFSGGARTPNPRKLTCSRTYETDVAVRNLRVLPTRSLKKDAASMVWTIQSGRLRCVQNGTIATAGKVESVASFPRVTLKIVQATVG